MNEEVPLWEVNDRSHIITKPPNSLQVVPHRTISALFLCLAIKPTLIYKFVSYVWRGILVLTA